MNDSNRAPVVVRHRVIYGDTDAAGVVYYGNYMRFIEIGRTEYLRAQGHTYKEIEAAGVVIPVAEVRLKYLAPARYDDELEIATTLEELRGASMTFGYEITCGDQVLARGSTKHACVDKSTGRVTRVPARVAEALGR